MKYVKKTRHKRKIFAVADFETISYKQITEHPNADKVWLGAIVYNKMPLKSNVGIVGERFLFRTIAEFMEIIIKQNDRFQQIIYFHNGGAFDYSYLISWMVNNGYIPKNDTRDIYLQPNEFTALIDGRNKSYIEIKLNINNGLIDFRDSIRILRMSVAEMGGKSYQIDFNKFRYPTDELDQEAIDYVFEDCEVVLKKLVPIIYTLKVRKKSKHGYYKASYPLTIGSCAIGNFCSHNWDVYEGQLLSKLSKAEWERLKRGYWGGYTYINERYAKREINSRIWCVDVNSMYPSIMREQVPVGEWLDEPPTDKPYTTYYEVEVISAKIKKGNFPLINATEGFGMASASYGNEITGKRMYVWDFYLKHLHKIYKMDCIATPVAYFELSNPFTEFIDHWYTKRLEAKAIGDEVTNQTAKLIANNIGGKFGENIEHSIVTFEIGNGITKHSYGTFHLKSEGFTECKEEKIRHIGVISYITAKGRVLINSGANANYDNFLYCDTDSLYLKGEPKGIEIDNDKLGAFKIEESNYTWFFGRHAKHYAVAKGDKLKIVVAGLMKRAIPQITKEMFVRGDIIKNGHNTSKHIDGCRFLENTDFDLNKKEKTTCKLRKLLNKDKKS